MLYEMATGATLFEGENPYVVMNSRLTGDPPAPRKVNPKVTPVLEEIILHALERNPANRYPSAGLMKAELDDYEKVPLTERWLQLQPPQIWKTRFRMVPIIAGLLLLNIILFLLLWWYLGASQKHSHQSRTQNAYLPLVGLVLDLPTGTGSEGEKVADISAARNTKGDVTLNYGCSKTGDTQDMRQ